jgi:hypothetical protein
MVDRYAKFATENLEVATARIGRVRDRTWGFTSRFPPVGDAPLAANDAQAAESQSGPAWIRGIEVDSGVPKRRVET